MPLPPHHHAAMLAIITDANRKANQILAGHRRQPSIVHALDPTLFTPELCDTLGYCQAQDQLLAGHSAIWGLYWVRRFYEESDGNDYYQVGQNIPPGNLDAWLQNGDFFQGVLPANAPRGVRLRAECWIISAQQNGRASQLIQGIRFLLDELRPGFGLDEYEAALSRLQDRPNASTGQIAAARLYRAAFQAVINALHTGEGEGWLTRFVDHPLRREILEPQWGVYRNGNHYDLALCVPTNAQQTITQADQVLRLRPYQGRLIATLGAMRRSGIDPFAHCFIGNDPLPALHLDSALLARVRRDNPFSPFIENQANLQIQASALWALTPANLAGDFLLGNQAPTVEAAHQLVGGFLLRKLDFRPIDRAQPQLLVFAGQNLVNIGAAPDLAAINADPWVQSLTEPQTHFVFDEQATLALSDHLVNQAAWTCSPGASIGWVGAQPSLHCKGNYGKKMAANVDVGRNYPLRAVVRFLPQAMRSAMLEEQPWQGEGVSWEPLCPSDPTFSGAVTQAGLVQGTLTVGEGIEVRVWVPSSKPHFWFRHGFNDPTMVDQEADFSSLDEIRQRYLHVYVPPGTHQIRWGGLDWVECEGPSYWEVCLSDLEGAWPERESDILELVGPDGQTTLLGRLTDRPEWCVQEVVMLEGNNFADFLSTNFELGDLQQRIDCMIIDGNPWPASSSWSGSSLNQRFQEIYARCIMSPNYQVRIPPLVQNPAQVRQFNPILDGLFQVSQGSRPVQVWLPAATFRFRPADGPYGYHRLLDRGPINGQWPLNDPRNYVLQCQFAYSGNTEFWLAGHQDPLLWKTDLLANALANETNRQVRLGLEPACHELIHGYFLAALGWSESLIGGLNDEHLASLFKAVSDTFSQNPDRVLSFRTAVICRLHARMEAHYPVGIQGDDPIRKLDHHRILGMLRGLCWSIGQNNDAREIFGSDLLTVDWALAWFHEPI